MKYKADRLKIAHTYTTIRAMDRNPTVLKSLLTKPNLVKRVNPKITVNQAKDTTNLPDDDCVFLAAYKKGMKCIPKKGHFKKTSAASAYRKCGN